MLQDCVQTKRLIYVREFKVLQLNYDWNFDMLIITLFSPDYVPERKKNFNPEKTV